MKIQLLLLLTGVLILSSCNQNTVYDQVHKLPADGWHYKNLAEFSTTIEDTTVTYDFDINLRVSQDYAYSNLHLLVTTITPASDTISQRVELALAQPDGKWLGKGSGPLVSFSVPITKNKAMKAGNYRWSIAQNMRTNTLKDITDIGLTIKKGEKVF